MYRSGCVHVMSTTYLLKLAEIVTRNKNMGLGFTWRFEQTSYWKYEANLINTTSPLTGALSYLIVYWIHWRNIELSHFFCRHFLTHLHLWAVIITKHVAEADISETYVSFESTVYDDRLWNTLRSDYLIKKKHMHYPYTKRKKWNNFQLFVPAIAIASYLPLLAYSG